MGRKRKVGEENFKDFHKFSFYLCPLISDSSQPKCFSETFLCFSFRSVSFFVFFLVLLANNKEAQKCAAERLSGTHFYCQIPKKVFSLFSGSNLFKHSESGALWGKVVKNLIREERQTNNRTRRRGEVTTRGEFVDKSQSTPSRATSRQKIVSNSSCNACPYTAASAFNSLCQHKYESRRRVLVGGSCKSGHQDGVTPCNQIPPSQA